MTDEAQRRGVSSRHTEKLVGKFDRFLQRSNSVLTESMAMRLRGEMLDEYRRLIPEVPYIGGRRNINAMPMTIAPYALALYRIVVRHGGSVEDTGELLHAITQSQFDRIPRMLRHWVGRQ